MNLENALDFDKYKSRLSELVGITPGKNITCISGTHDDRTPSMTIYSDYFKCHACGEHGDIYDYVGLKYGISDKKDQFQKVAELFGENMIIKSPIKQDVKKIHVRIIGDNPKNRFIAVAENKIKMRDPNAGDVENIQNYLGKKYSLETLLKTGTKICENPYGMAFPEADGDKRIIYNPDNNDVIFHTEGRTDFLTAIEIGLDYNCGIVSEYNKTSKIDLVNGTNNIFCLDADDTPENKIKFIKNIKNVKIKFIKTPPEYKDLSDWFNKGGCTKEEIIEIIKNTDPYEIPEPGIPGSDIGKKILAEISDEDIRNIKSLFEKPSIYDIIENDKNLKDMVRLDKADESIIIPDIYGKDLEFFQVLFKKYIKDNYGLKLSRDACDDALTYWKNQNKTNSVINYLDGLKSSVENPLNELIKHIRFKNHENFNAGAIAWEIFNLFFTKHLLKIYANDKGLEYVNDCVPILMGRQGIGKTLLVKMLAMEDRFYTDISSTGKDNLNDKDNFLNITKKLIAELSELSSIKGKDDVESIKAFISRGTDKFRPPYGRSSIEIKRTCSFVGTCNPDEGGIFMDTENRRFYPLEIESVNFEIFDKPEIIESIYAFYRDFAKKILNGSNCKKEMFALNIISQESKEYLANTHSEYRIANVYEDRIQKWIDEKTEDFQRVRIEEDSIGKVEKTELYFSCSDFKNDCFTNGNIPTTINRAFGAVMKLNGFTKKSIRVNNIPRKVWVKI